MIAPQTSALSCSKQISFKGGNIYILKDQQPTLLVPNEVADSAAMENNQIMLNFLAICCFSFWHFLPSCGSWAAIF